MTYSADDPLCAVCPHAQACAPVALERRSKLAELLSYRDSTDARKTRSVAHIARSEAPTETPKAVSAPKKEAPKAVISSGDTASLSKKALPVLKALERQGIDFAADVKSGRIRNDFDRIAAWLPIALEPLLTHGTVDRRAICRDLEEKLRWQRTTAASHVSIFTSLVTALGVCESDGHHLVRKA